MNRIEDYNNAFIFFMAVAVLCFILAFFGRNYLMLLIAIIFYFFAFLIKRNPPKEREERKKYFKKIVTITSLFFLLFSVNAVDVGIKSIELTSVQPLLENQDIQFKLTYSNYDENVDANATLELYSGTTLVDSSPVKLDNNMTYYSYLYWRDVNLTILKGDYTIKGKLNNISSDDSNSSNNEKTISITVNELANLKPINFVSDVYNPHKGDYINLEGYVYNSGDIDISDDFKACFYYKGEKKNCTTVTSLSAGETQKITYSLDVGSVSGTYDINFVVDDENVISESSESDNSVSLQLGVNGEKPDLSIVSNDINISGNLVINGFVNFNIKVRNIGTVDVNNAVIKVYKSSESQNNLLLTDTIDSIIAGSFVSFDLNYTPKISGYDTIIVKLDSSNLIDEESEANNSVEKGFEIIDSSGSGIEKYYTATINVSGKCLVLISNKDKISSDGIIEESGNYKIKLSYYDEYGNTLLSGSFKEGFETPMPGRTLKVLKINKFLAQVLVIFSSPITVENNTCQDDINKLENDAKYYLEQFQKCQEQLTKEVESKKAIINTNNNLNEQISTLNSSIAQCNSLKQTCESNLSNRDGNFLIQLSDARDEFNKEKNDAISQKQIEIMRLSKENKDIDFALEMWQILFFSIIIVVAGIFIINYRRNVS